MADLPKGPDVKPLIHYGTGVVSFHADDIAVIRHKAFLSVTNNLV